MKTFRFLDFPVYQQARQFYREILLITASLKERSLNDQLRRASLSVVLNIAEGSARKSDKEFARFLQSSLGSINEVFACLDVIAENHLVDSRRVEELRNMCESIARQLGGLFKKLTTSG